MEKEELKPDTFDVKKEPTSLQIIKGIGLVSFMLALIDGDILLGLGIGFVAFIVITLLETFYYGTNDFVRHHLRLLFLKIFLIIISIITLIILIILFSRSLFEGFIALIAVIILLLIISKE